MTVSAQPKRLLVMAGGGLPGLDLLAGMLLGLAEHGYEGEDCWDRIIGTSAGAIAGAFVAAGYTAEQIAGILHSLQERDVVPRRFLWKLRALWIDHFIKPAGVKRVFAEHLPEDFKDLQCRFEAVCCNRRTGMQRNFKMGPFLRDCVRASMSIAGFFPAVEIAGDEYVDGGPVANLALPPDWRDYDEVFLLVPSQPIDFDPSRRDVFTEVRRNLDFALADQVNDPLEEVTPYAFFPEGLRTYESEGTGPLVHIIRPPVAQPTGLLHFSHGLIREAQRHTTAQLNRITEGA